MSGRSYQSEVPLLEVRNLSISHAPSGRVLVGPLSLTLRAGECLALVGDSGSGKSLTLRALLRLLPTELNLSADALLSRGRSLSRASEREWNELRGAEVAVIQQDTGLALDPLSRIEREVREAALVSARRSRASLQDYGPGFVTDQLRDSGLTDPEEFLRRWPHQLSGGQRQRVVLASSLSAAPDVLLADEPTTALDAVAQDAVLARLETFVRQGGGLLLVSHDEAVVRRLADRVLYLEDGELRDTRAHSLEPTRPVRAVRRAAPATPLCEARALSYEYESGRGIADLSIRLDAGTVVGLLGPSGSGKTTFAKALTGLLPGVRGEVTLDGLDWLQLPERRRRRNRWRMQWVPQDPLASFPRGRTVADILDEALHCHGRIDSGTPRRAGISPRADTHRLRDELLDAVGLDCSIADRKPATLSGGQRQRVAIARALAVKPQVVICDEPISALDARAQDGILDLLRTVAIRDGCAVLFISHDNRAVRSISDRVLVLHEGHIIDAPD